MTEELSSRRMRLANPRTLVKKVTINFLASENDNIGDNSDTLSLIG